MVPGTEHPVRLHHNQAIPVPICILLFYMNIFKCPKCKHGDSVKIADVLGETTIGHEAGEAGQAIVGKKQGAWSRPGNETPGGFSLPSRNGGRNSDPRAAWSTSPRYPRWYGCPAMIVVARYSCSIRIKRTSMCGRVSGPSDQRWSARASTSGAWPSGPPIRNATSRPRMRQFCNWVASASLDQF